MPRHDLHNSIKVTQAVKPQVVSSNTTTVGTIIDLAGYETCEFAIAYGTMPDADIVPLLEEGDASNLSDAAAVADGDLLGTEAEAGATQTTDEVVNKLGYRGGKRYVRLSLVSTSTTGDNPVSAVAILGGSNNQRVEPDGATPG